MKRSWIKPSTKPKRIEEKQLDGLFQQACLIRDNNRCQAPGCKREATGGVHHLIPRKYKAVRHYMPNGVSLCITCHHKIHEGKDKLGFKLAIIYAMTIMHQRFDVGGFTVMEADAHMSIKQGGAEHLENFINEHK